MLLLLSVHFCIAVAAALKVPRAVDPSVTISSGVLVGTATKVSNQPVTELATAYLGIPYAASPTRFAPPTTPTSWATKTVKSLKPICHQQYPSDAAGSKLRSLGENPFGPTPLPESEDCLNLNVYVPPGTQSTSKRAVLFYLYGGNLETGGNSLQYYNGSSLAVNNKVIVVVPNYRTNFFGFSNSPDIPRGKQNSGFLDQRLALTWVQDNIVKFGGDPQKVTIFGQSAGAYSVKQLLANPPNPRPFRAAIMQSSGRLFGNGPDAWTNVSKHFNCNPAPSGETQTSCLRKIKATDIQSYISLYNVRTEPVLDDGTYSASRTLDELENKKFADVPLLIGTTLDEMTIFTDALGINDQSPVAASVAKLTGIDVSKVPGADSLKSTYPGQTGRQLINRVATDLAFGCPNALFARAVSDNINSGVWRYRFDGVFPSVSYFPGIGAYHSSDIPEVWGTYPLATKYGTSTPDQVALSKYMQKVWTDFAINPSAGPQPNVWPEFVNPSTPTKIGVLGGRNNSSGLDVQDAIWTDYPCAAYAPLLVGIGFAY